MKVIAKTGLAVLVAGVFNVSNVWAHATGNISLQIEGGKLIAKSVDTGEVLSENTVYQNFFSVDREWDERKIYTNVDAQGTPKDDNGNSAYVGGSSKPYLKDSGSSKNPLYNVDDYAWGYYDNAFSLPVKPGEDGSVDNQNITLNILSYMKVWDGRGFVQTGGEKPTFTTWDWTSVGGDGVTNKYDSYKFPDGGWYAYPVNPVRPAPKGSVPAGTYNFAPGDHYHWMVRLGSEPRGSRDKGVYLITINFSSDAPGVQSSQPINVLIANGLGSDLLSSVNHPKYLEALANLKK